MQAETPRVKVHSVSRVKLGIDDMALLLKAVDLIGSSESNDAEMGKIKFDKKSPPQLMRTTR